MNNTSSAQGENIDNLHDLCPEGVMSQPSLIAMITLHAISCVVAVVGNGLVITAVIRTCALRKVSMFFIASLSAADLVLAFNMNALYIINLGTYEIPFEDLPIGFWDTYTKVENYFWIQTLTATTFSLCAVSVDRFVAVIRPLHYHQLITETRCYCAISSVWLFSFGLPVVRFFISDFYERRYMWLACSIVAIAVPFILVVICYAQIYRITRRQVRSIRENSTIDSQTTSRKDVVSNRKTVVTATIVTGMFFALLFPVVIVFIMLLLVQDYCLDLVLNSAWMWVALISFSHSAFNPWVYCYRSKQFRRAFKQIVCHT